MNRSLLPYARIVTCQLGEDGIIAELVRRLNFDTNPGSRWLVDVGAHDGLTDSNTHQFRVRGWSSVNIERDKNRFAKLHNYCCWIGPGNAFCFPNEVTSSPGSLDGILDIVRGMPAYYHLLNLDTDGPDLDIWENHTQRRAAIVVVEVHGGIPPGKLRRHSADTPYSSWSTTLEVAKKKQYTLVASLGNMIFVDDAMIENVGLTEEELQHPDWLWIPPHVRGLLVPLLLAKRDFDKQFDEGIKRFARCPSLEEIQRYE